MLNVPRKRCQLPTVFWKFIWKYNLTDGTIPQIVGFTSHAHLVRAHQKIFGRRSPFQKLQIRQIRCFYCQSSHLSTAWGFPLVREVRWGAFDRTVASRQAPCVSLNSSQDQSVEKQKYISTSDKTVIPGASMKTRLAAVVVYKLFSRFLFFFCCVCFRGKLAQLEIRWLVSQA